MRWHDGTVAARTLRNVTYGDTAEGQTSQTRSICSACKSTLRRNISLPSYRLKCKMAPKQDEDDGGWTTIDHPTSSNDNDEEVEGVRERPGSATASAPSTGWRWRK